MPHLVETEHFRQRNPHERPYLKIFFTCVLACEYLQIHALFRKTSSYQSVEILPVPCHLWKYFRSSVVYVEILPVPWSLQKWVLLFMTQESFTGVRQVARTLIVNCI